MSKSHSIAPMTSGGVAAALRHAVTPAPPQTRNMAAAALPDVALRLVCMQSAAVIEDGDESTTLSDHAEAVLLAAFPAGHVPVVAATACVVPFLLDPAAAPGRMSPWHMKLRCLDLITAFLLGVSSAVCTRQPPAASVLASFCLPAWSSVRAWLLRLRTVFDFAPEHLPALDPVLHMSAPVRRGAVADARLGLA